MNKNFLALGLADWIVLVAALAGLILVKPINNRSVNVIIVNTFVFSFV